MSQLSNELMVSNGNVTGLVDRLAREGHVDRTPSPDDRRVQMVSLTKSGAKFFEQIAKDHRDWVGAMMADLSADASLVEAVGSEVCANFVANKEAEWERYLAAVGTNVDGDQVTDWELAEYLMFH